MLTSGGNQYLRPEYLNPIQPGNSIELDAKKSPLALLAQTCSQIGADLPQKTPALSSGDKTKKSSPTDKSPTQMGPSEDSKTPSSCFKPYEKKKEEDEDRSSPKRGTPVTRSPGQESRPRSTSRSSDGGRSSSKPVEGSTLSPRISSPKGPSGASSNPFSALGDLSKDPLAAYKIPAGVYPPLCLGLDPLGAAGLSVALAGKVPSVNTVSSLSSPYVGYARVKTVTGSEVVVPICRDPYCAGCQINMHTAQVVSGTCPPGCSQCAQISAHTKTLASLPSLLPTLPPSSLASLYPPPGLIGGSPQPYVCNWISGDTYCGKRFTTSDELLQHLRSHTSLSVSESSALHSLHHPLLSGHLPRGYSTPSLSPLSAAGRYHPYAKPPLPHLPPTAHLPGASALSSLSALAPHPLSAYYNPYSLYARGLGAAASLHP